MNYIEPATIEEALSIISQQDNARCIAGGASLVAMMNADLVMSDCLIGLRLIDELKGIDINKSEVRIGAMTTHNTIAAEQDLQGNASVVRDAARQIAHPAVRNMGTIGGSICHADPNADFPTALTAANAVMDAVSENGQRSIPVSEFFVDYYETALQENELLTAIRIPVKPENVSGVHLKHSRTDGDFATVSVAIVLEMKKDTCRYIRIALGSVASTPLHLDEVDALLTGSTLGEVDLDKAANLFVEAADPIDDMRGSADYRRNLIPGLLKRAVEMAKDKLATS